MLDGQWPLPISVPRQVWSVYRTRILKRQVWQKEEVFVGHSVFTQRARRPLEKRKREPRTSSWRLARGYAKAKLRLIWICPDAQKTRLTSLAWQRQRAGTCKGKPRPTGGARVVAVKRPLSPDWPKARPRRSPHATLG